MACALACAIGCIQALAEPPSVEVFARDPLVDWMELSPDGTRVALRMQGQGTPNLALLDLSTGKTGFLTTLKSPDSVYNVAWKSDRYLFYQAITGASHEPLLAGIDLQTHKQFRLNEPWEWIDFADMQWNDPTRLLLTFYGGYNHFVLQAQVRDASPGYQFARSTTAEGRRAQFFVDSKSTVRAALTWEEDDTRRLLYRDQPDGRWQELTRFESDGEVILPLAFTEDDRQLYVLSNVGRDTMALFTYDPQTRKLGDLLFEADGADISSDGIYGPGLTHLLAVRYETQGKGVHYVHPGAQEIHLAALAAFPSMQSQPVSFDADMSRAIIHVRSPQTPGSFYLYDRATRSMRNIMDVAPWVDAKQMASLRPFSAVARDGLTLHGYLAIPHASTSQDLPLIVSITGDAAGTRHFANFDPLTQLLASRGYAVLLLDPRGSSGYGRKYRHAAYQNWHVTVPADVVDAVDALVKDGIADPHRVGLFGSDFGGYVALLTLLRSPEHFRSAVIYGGFADPQAMVDMRRVWIDTQSYRPISQAGRIRMRRLLGSGREDAAAAQRDLLRNLSHIQVPILIAHGRADSMVPFTQAQALADALSNDPGGVFTYFPAGEDHEFWKTSSRVAFYRALERFWARSLAPAPVESSASASPAQSVN